MTRAQVRPHRFEDDPDARDTCRRCHLIRRHGAHGEQAVAELDHQAATAAAEARRRLGEHD